MTKFGRKWEYVKYFVGFILFVGLVFGAGFVATTEEQLGSAGEELLGVGPEGSTWTIVDVFTGFKTKVDASKLDSGANPNGQNTSINDGDRISVRNLGTDLFPTGTVSTTASRISSLHTFRKRSGENLVMRSVGTYMEWYEEGNDAWEVLKTGLTADKEFGFADYNINADLVSYTYFGNAVDPFFRWTGNHTLVNGALAGGEGTITVDSTTGFPSSGTIIYCGTELAYSGKTATTFTVVSAHACADNRGVAQAVEATASNPRGNIYLVANNRLFISGVASSTQAVFFSAYGNATDFSSAAIVNSSTAASPGIFNLGEGGGGVTAMVQDENAIYIFKRSIIYKATLNDSLYSLTALKSFDGKSQTTGAVNSRSVFAGGNGIFFVTPDNQIMNLARVETIDYPQIIPISDSIKPTVDSINFASSTGIVWKDNAYFSVRSVDATANDSVFVWNIRRQAWESPIIGWNVGDWTVYDDGDGEDLYWGDSATANTYKVTGIPLDNEFDVTANWRSKQYDFGAPQYLKELDNFFVEGYIADNTTLTISLLLDENGFSQTYTTNFTGTESSFLYAGLDFNLFGFHPFGYERFGSNQDQSGKKKFRVYLNKNLRRVPFYNLQVEFASDGQNQQWEVLRYGFEYRVHSQPENRSIYRAF